MNKAVILKVVFVFAIATWGLAQVPDVAGEWKVVPTPAAQPSSTMFEEWLRALPGATYTLTLSDMPPLAMIHKNLGYTYFPSRPTITIVQRTTDGARALGFLQSQGDRRFAGEFASLEGGCWMHLSLEASDDGRTLSGSARINAKISTRACRNRLQKEVKNGEPFPYALIRVK